MIDELKDRSLQFPFTVRMLHFRIALARFGINTRLRFTIVSSLISPETDVYLPIGPERFNATVPTDIIHYHYGNPAISCLPRNPFAVTRPSLHVHRQLMVDS